MERSLHTLSTVPVASSVPECATVVWLCECVQLSGCGYTVRHSCCVAWSQPCHHAHGQVLSSHFSCVFILGACTWERLLSAQCPQSPHWLCLQESGGELRVAGTYQ